MRRLTLWILAAIVLVFGAGVSLGWLAGSRKSEPRSDGSTLLPSAPEFWGDWVATAEDFWDDLAIDDAQRRELGAAGICYNTYGTTATGTSAGTAATCAYAGPDERSEAASASSSVMAPQLTALKKKFSNPCPVAASSNTSPTRVACAAFSTKFFKRIDASS